MKNKIEKIYIIIILLFLVFIKSNKHFKEETIIHNESVIFYFENKISWYGYSYNNSKNTIKIFINDESYYVNNPIHLLKTLLKISLIDLKFIKNQI